MGLCLSCLGLSRKESSNVEPSETSGLLNSRQSQPRYGAAESPDAYHDHVDPGQQHREREALNAIWKSTSDKLIDISSTAPPLAADNAAAAAAAGPAEIDFERLFRETFPRVQRRSRPSSAAAVDGPGEQRHETTVHEQTWLRDIITRDPSDKSWDCNTVFKIGKPLIIEFDEVAGKSEGGGAAKAGKDAKRNA